VAVALDQFVNNLAATGLMSAAEVDGFLRALPGQDRPQDAESLARARFQAGKLTRYQAQAIYQGQTKGLVKDRPRVWCSASTACWTSWARAAWAWS